jgi:DNA repair protein RecN (Recombination protein N)
VARKIGKECAMPDDHGGTCGLSSKICEGGTSSKAKMRLQSPFGCDMKESTVLGDTFCSREPPVLAELNIRNFAIIDELFVSFEPGLTVITGETGAGKSILVNAMNLLLGSRGSADLIRGGSQEATVTALFVRSEPNEEVLVQRTLSASGRSRVQVNGELGTVGALGDLCRGLVSISGQHEHQLFLDPDVQLHIVDRYGELEEMREAYGAVFTRVREEAAGLERLRRQLRERREREELHRFQAQEITTAKVEPDEEIGLAREREILRHAERLQQGAAGAYEILYGESGAVLDRVGECGKLIADLGRLDPALQPPAATLEQIRHQLEDVALALRDYYQRIEADPTRLQWVEERLDLLHRLMRKYGGTTRAVLGHAETLRRELAAVEDGQAEIAAKEGELERIREQAGREAEALSSRRRQTAERLAHAVEGRLRALDMPHSRFTVRFETNQGPQGDGIRVGDRLLDMNGMDRITFLFSANPGEEPRPMAKIASGGELSRIVLALKELQARETAEETLIFDEVDAGIGGRTADMVGQRLKALAGRHQVICITHLPQIACYGERHFAVRKGIRQGRTTTSLEELSGENRLEEIARMLGGQKVSTRTRAHAREMLEQAQRTGIRD